MDVLLELGRRAKPDALPSVAKHLMMFESQIKDLVLSQGGMITSQTSRDLRPLQPPTTPGTLLCINPPSLHAVKATCSLTSRASPSRRALGLDPAPAPLPFPSSSSAGTPPGTTTPVSPRAPGLPTALPGRPRGRKRKRNGDVCGPLAMAGRLEPHLEALGRELRPPDPAVLSVLLALLAVAITLREFWPAGDTRCPVAPWGPAGEQRPPGRAR